MAHKKVNRSMLESKYKRNYNRKNSDDFRYTRMVRSWAGMSIETRKFPYILQKRTDDDITILSVSLDEVSQYLSGISHVKISGMVRGLE